MKSIAKKSLPVYLAFFVVPSILHGARVISCKEGFKNHDQVCVLRQDSDEAVKLGSQVVVFKDDAYWSATGSIIKIKGSYSLGAFHEFVKMPKKGLYAIIKEPGSEKLLDWDQAFSGSDPELMRDKT